MTSTSVDKRLVYYEDNDLWLRFSTIADALVAREMLLDHGRPVGPTNGSPDQQPFADPDFRASDVTIRTMADLDGLISEQARERSARRSGAHQNSPFRTAGMPNIVLDCVLECIASMMTSIYREMGPLLQLNNAPEMRPNPAVRALLSTMSLVHRSWTGAAQNVLRRRVYMRTEDQLLSFARGPHCGPWVREFGYLHIYEGTKIRLGQRGVEPTSGDGSRKRHLTTDLICSILQRTPNLQSFGCVFEPMYRRSKWVISDILQQIGRTASLRTLYIHTTSSTQTRCYTLEELCRAVSHLHRLTFLSIRGWDSVLGGGCQHGGESAPGSIAELLGCSPPRSLETIFIAFPSFAILEIDEPLVSWLLRPRGEFSLKRLMLRNISLSEDSLNEVLAFLAPLPHSLACLYLGIEPENPGTYRSFYLPFVIALLSGCTHLKALYLGELYGPGSGPGSTSAHRNFLPATLETLCVPISYGTKVLLKDSDAELLWLLSSNKLPNLHLMLLDDHWSVYQMADAECKEVLGEGVGKVDFGDNMPLTSKLCAQSGIQVRRTDASSLLHFMPEWLG